MSEYVILMRESDRAWSKLSPDEQQRLLEQYYAWVEDLREQGIFKGGNPLGYEGARLLRSLDGEIVDGPFTETKEVLTGYFVIEAADDAAAVEIAKGCPGLLHGETIELRPTGHE